MSGIGFIVSSFLLLASLASPTPIEVADTAAYANTPPRSAGTSKDTYNGILPVPVGMYDNETKHENMTRWQDVFCKRP